MVFETLKKGLMDADADMRSYIDASEDYYKLKIFKVVVKSITSIAQVFLIAFFLMLALFLFSFGISIALNKALNSYYIGFIIVGLFYLITVVLCYVFRDYLHKPVIRNFSKHYFN